MKRCFLIICFFIFSVSDSFSQCDDIYVTTYGSGLGTKASPASLSFAMSIAVPGSIIRLDTGLYIIDNPLNLIDSITIEGGFYASLHWQKSSEAGITEIQRSDLNPEGATNSNRLVAFYGSNNYGFVFQDVTISTVSATLNGCSTYGLHLASCSDYLIRRTQVTPGNAAPGINGTAGTNGIAGANGFIGLSGSCDGNCNGNFCTETAPGGAGAAGGMGSGGALGGSTNTSQTVSNPGADATGREGGGGGAGGKGGGFSGGNNAVNGSAGGASASAPQNTAGGAFGAQGDPGVAGATGGVGTIGATGLTGSTGNSGTHVSGFFVPGTVGGVGGDAAGGSGGAGGGGGGRQWCTLCDSGPGNGGSGGGGGGQGGTGGTGGTGGGASFPIYMVNNGFNTQFIDCYLKPGLGGPGGSGGPGGLGGNGGLGGISNNFCSGEIGKGGAGGNGGNGGVGGIGGPGAVGDTASIYLASGNAPITQTSLDLANQAIIIWNGMSCKADTSAFSATSSATWNFTANAIPSVVTGTSASIKYQTTGRHDVTFGADSYLGFVYIDPNSPDDADAGVDQTICYQAPTALNATQPSSGTSYWTSFGPATVSDSSLYNTSVSNLVPGNNFFVWNVTTGTCCPPSTDTVNIFMLALDSASTSASACDTFFWAETALTYYTSGVYSATYTNVSGCDSIVSLDLTILQSTSSIDIQFSCGPFAWYDGLVYTSSNNTATLVYQNAAGCDSIVTLNLTVISAVNNSVTNNGSSLTSNQPGASYQWLDCGNNHAIINGATNQTYTPSANGNYAVEVSMNVCIDTSQCNAVTTVGVMENDFESILKVYPNPTNGNLTIDLGETQTTVTVSVTNLEGKLISSHKIASSNLLSVDIEGEPNVYIIEILTGAKKRAKVKVVKQ